MIWRLVSIIENGAYSRVSWHSMPVIDFLVNYNSPKKAKFAK